MDNFGQRLHPRRDTRPGRSGLRYDGGPLFSVDLAFDVKLRRVLGHDPPILRLQRRGPDGGRFESEWRVFNALDSAGLRLPYCQYPIERFRVDFAYPEWRLAIEADGPVHRMEADRKRDRQLHDAGWHIVRLRQDEYELQLPDLAQLLAARILLLAEGTIRRSDVIVDSRRFELAEYARDENSLPGLDAESNERPMGFRGLEDLDVEFDDDWSSVFDPDR